MALTKVEKNTTKAQSFIMERAEDCTAWDKRLKPLPSRGLRCKGRGELPFLFFEGCRDERRLRIPVIRAERSVIP